MQTSFDMTQFEKIKKLILEKAGLLINNQKANMVLQKLDKMLKEGELKNLSEYYSKLLLNPSEFQKLVNYLTVNETYFFREFEQLRVFAEVILPEVVEKKRQRADNRIKIWVAGCASGDEAYTIAIILNEFLSNDITYDIIATDIDTNALKVAEEGCYEQRNVRFIHTHYLNKYFDINKDCKYKIKDGLNNKVQFLHHNLMDFSKYFIFSKSDFIFCRNVLIYFGDEQRKEVINKMYDALNDGGYLFLGHSESVGRLSDKFNVRKINDYFFYYK